MFVFVSVWKGLITLSFGDFQKIPKTIIISKDQLRLSDQKIEMALKVVLAQNKVQMEASQPWTNWVHECKERHHCWEKGIAVQGNYSCDQFSRVCGSSLTRNDQKVIVGPIPIRGGFDSFSAEYVTCRCCCFHKLNNDFLSERSLQFSWWRTVRSYRIFKTKIIRHK